MNSSRQWILLGVVLAVAAACLFGCGSSGDTDTTTPSDDATTATSQELATLPDGTQFGYIHQVSDGTLVFDPAEWLTGDAAVTAAREDGYIGPNESLDEDFYVRNEAEERLLLAVDPAATFTVYLAPPQADLTTKTLTLQELAQLSPGATATTDSTGAGYYAGFPLPVDLTISGGKVTGGKQHYVP
jgi:hypothetical protein